jgi:hypothetical protein
MLCYFNKYMIVLKNKTWLVCVILRGRHNYLSVVHDTSSSNTTSILAMSLKVSRHPLPFVTTCGDANILIKEMIQKINQVNSY